ncbi:hypothetical protein F4X90_03130 [Candidatus Poribacteria bacterium]|nr:hypothetical protein [Candidatus Poribacteria bacterium]
MRAGLQNSNSNPPFTRKYRRLASTLCPKCHAEGQDSGHGQRDGLGWQDTGWICAVQKADGTLRSIHNSAILRVMFKGLLRPSEFSERSVYRL